MVRHLFFPSPARSAHLKSSSGIHAMHCFRPPSCHYYSSPVFRYDNFSSLLLMGQGQRMHITRKNILLAPYVALERLTIHKHSCNLRANIFRNQMRLVLEAVVSCPCCICILQHPASKEYALSRQPKLFHFDDHTQPDLLFVRIGQVVLTYGHNPDHGLPNGVDGHKIHGLSHLQSTSRRVSVMVHSSPSDQKSTTCVRNQKLWCI